MNNSSFNSISELNDFKRTLNLSSDTAFIKYLQTIHSNLLQRETDNLRKSFYTKKISSGPEILGTVRKSVPSNKSLLQKLNSENGICLKTFLEYMNVQELIGERLFKYFNKSKTNILNKTEFINGFNDLYYCDISELIKLTFNLCDFNEDGKIYKSDMRLFLVYIPSSSETFQKIKIKQINKIMNAFFDETFPNQPKDKEPEIGFDLFSKKIKEYDENMKSQNIVTGEFINDFNNNAPFFYFISILSYLFLNCPFTVKNVNYFANKTKTIKFVLRRNETKSQDYKKLLMTTIKKTERNEGDKETNGLMTNFNEKNKFNMNVITKIGKKKLFQTKRSTSQRIIIQDRNYIRLGKVNTIRENKKERDFIIAREKEDLISNKVKIDKNIFKKRMNNNPCFASPVKRNNFNDSSKSPKINSYINKNNDNDEITDNNHIITSKRIQGLKSSLKGKLPSIHKEKFTPLSVGFNLKKDDRDIKEPTKFALFDCSESEDSQKNLEIVRKVSNADLISAYCYKVTEETNNLLNPKIINKFYAVLSGKEILFFKNESKNDFHDLWYIYKSHITVGRETINITKYFTVNINFFNSNSVNKLYFSKENECHEFAKKVKKAIHDLSFNDFYELGESIGEGNFAKVSKCTNKFSNKICAVKVINKTNLKPKDLELIHQEKSYLSLIKHPNIIGLIDYFEDKKSIYLVTEYCAGGDILSFIEKNHEVSEKTAARIVRKIAEGIKYLNFFGIVHRDIKPENILFSQENDIKSLKIIDLGVCQTLTYGQMANEPIGTNGYISPEIYMHKEYNFKTDIWSLGIILYLLITQGMLPFDNDNMDNKVIGKKVIYLQQEYPEEYFGKCSVALENLLDKMLEKNMEKRIDIINLLNDSWFNIIKKQ